MACAVLASRKVRTAWRECLGHPVVESVVASRACEALAWRRASGRELGWSAVSAVAWASQALGDLAERGEELRRLVELVVGLGTGLTGRRRR